MPNVGKKIFHVCMIALIIIIILTVATIFILRYQIVGETNLPFELSKITIISSIGGKNNEDLENKWNINIEQNNDIYLYLEKNNNFRKTEIIESISINNFSIKQENNPYTINIYKPSSDSIDIFKNIDTNIAKEINYTGDMQSDIKNLKISNQGGIVAFRCTNENVANFVSNEAEEINYNNLLKLSNIPENSLKAEITFDLSIKLHSKKEYKSTITVNIPVENIVENGTTSIELTDLDSFIFKRVEK